MTRDPPAKEEVCPVCGRTYDPRKPDEEAFHAGDHTGERPDSGIVGMRVGEVEADEEPVA